VESRVQLRRNGFEAQQRTACRNRTAGGQPTAEKSHARKAQATLEQPASAAVDHLAQVRLAARDDRLVVERREGGVKVAKILLHVDWSPQRIIRCGSERCSVRHAPSRPGRRRCAGGSENAWPRRARDG